MTHHLCRFAHCWHARPRSRILGLVALLTPWMVVACCICDRLRLVRKVTRIK